MAVRVSESSPSNVIQKNALAGMRLRNAAPPKSLWMKAMCLDFSNIFSINPSIGIWFTINSERQIGAALKESVNQLNLSGI